MGPSFVTLFKFVPLPTVKNVATFEIRCTDKKMKTTTIALASMRDEG